MKRALLLASGGLDSTTVGYQLVTDGFDVSPVFFDYGQHCVEMEWSRVTEVLPSQVRPPERIHIADIFSGSRSRLIREADLWNEVVNDDDLYVPYRTMLFFAAAAARAQTIGMLDVYTGFINSNHAKEIDCTAAFMNSLDELAANVGAVRFHSPFRHSSKVDVARAARQLGVPIGRTYSCQASA